jgi:adhesin/invasin
MVRLMKKVAPFLIVFASLTATACSDSTVAPLVASGLNKVSGDAQSAAIGSTLPNPLVVMVIDQNGSPLSGVAVTWNLVSADGALSATSSTTDASGLAQVVWTLGSVPGSETAAASAGSYSTSFSAIAVEDASSSARVRAR